MSDKIDREIEEILNRLDESSPREDSPDGAQDASHRWMAHMRRTIVSHLPRISRRRAVLASLVFSALIAAGLVFGPINPSFGTSESPDSEISRGSADDQIGQGVNVDDTRVEGSAEGPDTEESEQRADGTREEHDEHDREGGEHR